MYRKLFTLLAGKIAFLLVFPLILLSRFRLPEYTGFTATSQWLSFIPGYSGILLRRIWYQSTLRGCGSNLTVDWLAVIRTRDTEIGNRCTIGVGSWIGWARLGDDVMSGNHVTILSGGKQHAYSDLSRPIRQQKGEKRQIIIGNDVWIGSGAIIMSDISEGTVIGAGSIVTKIHPKQSVIAGNPARILKKRS